MTEAKHTPGPWMVTPYGDVAPFVENWLVASCGSKSGLYRNHEANSRLIAAAAELLEALQHAVRWFDQLKPEDVARYRIAIAKATGSSQ